jgi:hypothetical protein
MGTRIVTVRDPSRSVFRVKIGRRRMFWAEG